MDMDSNVEKVMSGADVLPHFPTSLIIENILPFLDRDAYEMVVTLNRDIYENAKVSSALPAPWPEKILLQRESGIKVSCVAFSSSSNAVACGCEDGSVFLWSRRNGRRQKLLPSQAERVCAGTEVLSIAFSPNERYLAAGNVDTTIQVWKLGIEFTVDTSNESFRLPYVDQRPVHSLSFFPNSDILASAGHDECINLWDLSAREHIGKLKHTEKVESIAVAPDGKTLASSTWDGTIRAFMFGDDGMIDHESPNVKLLGKGLPLTSVQWSKDGKFLHGLKGFRLRRWELDETKDCTCWSGRRVNRIHSIALSSNGKRIAYAEGDGTIRMSTLASAYYKADLKRTLSGHSEACTMHFSPDGKCLASASGDGSLRLWNVV
jgi:WD40 repeat protein